MSSALVRDSVLYPPLFACRAYLLHTGCFAITTVFSHAQTVVVCASCASILCQPTGGLARLTEGMLGLLTLPRIV